MASSGSKVTPPILSDETLAFLVTDIANDKGITDYDEEKTLAIVKKSMVDHAAQKDTAMSVQSYSLTASSSCEWAVIDFSIAAVGLAMSAAGMPGGAGKKVGKKLINKVRNKLKDKFMKEMRSIIAEHFGSPNPLDIAAGLIAIFNLIIGEIGIDDVLGAIWDNVNFFDAIIIVATFTLYFVSGGTGLIAKLALMTPDIIDVVDAGFEVGNAC